MHVTIATIGSGGDVYPYIAVGRALAARGHAVTLLTNPHFAPHVAGAGLEFVPVGTEAQYQRAVTHPDLVHPRRSPRFVISTLVRETAREMYVATRRTVRRRHSGVILRHLIALGAGWAAEREHTPEAVGVLAPAFWLSVADASEYRAGAWRWLPAWALHARLRLGKVLARLLFDPMINAARREAGLDRQPGTFLRAITGGDLSLGLWSPAFRGPAADDPAHGRICGFAWHDGGGDSLSPALEHFLASGPPPIVVTLGTSVVHHAGDFYDQARDAAGRLGRRVVLVCGPAAGGIAPSRDVLAVGYAPFSLLLPRAAGVLHHGGIGTTAQGLRAGVPQVIVPFANDEFDNAARARRLGVSVTLHTGRLSRERLRRALAAALEGQAPTLAAAFAARLHNEDGAAVAANHIEALGRAGRARPHGPHPG